MTEDLVALVTSEPSFRYEIIEVHSGHRIEEDEWFLGNLGFRLAKPYLEKSYRLESAQHPIHSGTMPLGAGLTALQSAVAYDHPFLTFHTGDLILIRGNMRFARLEKNSDLTEKVVVLPFEQAVQEASVEVDRIAITRLDQIPSTLIQGSLAIEILDAYKELGLEVVMRKYFP